MIKCYELTAVFFFWYFGSTCFLQVWDAELAKIAQKWADNCDYSHDANDKRNVPGRYCLCTSVYKVEMSSEDFVDVV